MNEFINNHYIITGILVFSAIEATMKILGRILRTINIAMRGYPTAQFMDADGDIVFPKNKRGL